MATKNGWLSVKQIAAEYEISRQAVYKWINNGFPLRSKCKPKQIPRRVFLQSTKIATLTVVSRKHLDQFVAAWNAELDARRMVESEDP